MKLNTEQELEKEGRKNDWNGASVYGNVPKTVGSNLPPGSVSLLKPRKLMVNGALSNAVFPVFLIQYYSIPKYLLR